MSETAATTATAAGLTGEIAVARTDPTRWFYGDRFPNDDPVLVARGSAKGLALFDELERDPQVAAMLVTRRVALLGREWSVQAGGEDAQSQAAADLVERALKGCRFNQATEALLDAILKGVAIVEVMWVIRGGEVLPAELRGRDPRRFAMRLPQDAPADPAMPPPIAELRLLTKANSMEGDPLPDRKFIVHRMGAKYAAPWGLGLGSRLFWPVYFKRQGIGSWLAALEKFGQPTTLGKYPLGTAKEEQDKLLAACAAVNSEAAVIVPEGMAMELLEAQRAGAFDSYGTLARYMDDDIARVVVGQTLTSSAGEQGSRALGQVHNSVRLEITKGDADLLSDTLSGSLVRWIVDLNMPAFAGLGLPYPAIWWDVSEPEDLNARADRDVKVKGLGYKPTAAYIAETYGEGWEPDAPPPAAPVPGGDPLAALFAERSGTTFDTRLQRLRDRRPPPPRDTADDLTDQLDSVSGDAQDAIINALRGMVNSPDVQSLDDIRRGLLKLLPTCRCSSWRS